MRGSVRTNEAGAYGKYVPAEWVRKEAAGDTQHNTAQHSTAQHITAQGTTQQRAQRTTEHTGHRWGTKDKPRRAQQDQQKGKNRRREPLVTDRMLQLIRELGSSIKGDQ